MKCKIEECSNIATHKEKELCQKHYMRLYRHGDPLIVKKSGKEKKNRKCSVDECNNPHYGKDFCFMHYMRKRRYGDPSIVNEKGRKIKRR
jgi:hypothetical protein